jgi:hypothetical protein
LVVYSSTASGFSRSGAQSFLSIDNMALPICKILGASTCGVPGVRVILACKNKDGGFVAQHQAVSDSSGTIDSWNPLSTMGWTGPQPDSNTSSTLAFMMPDLDQRWFPAGPEFCLVEDPIRIHIAISPRSGCYHVAVTRAPEPPACADTSCPVCGMLSAAFASLLLSEREPESESDWVSLPTRHETEPVRLHDAPSCQELLGGRRTQDEGPKRRWDMKRLFKVKGARVSFRRSRLRTPRRKLK